MCMVGLLKTPCRCFCPPLCIGNKRMKTLLWIFWPAWCLRKGDFAWGTLLHNLLGASGPDHQGAAGSQILLSSQLIRFWSLPFWFFKRGEGYCSSSHLLAKFPALPLIPHLTPMAFGLHPGHWIFLFLEQFRFSPVSRSLHMLPCLPSVFPSFFT